MPLQVTGENVRRLSAKDVLPCGLCARGPVIASHAGSDREMRRVTTIMCPGCGRSVTAYTRERALQAWDVMAPTEALI